MLNERFYRAKPGDYLRTRLQLMLLAASKAEALSELLAAGVSYGEVRLSFEESATSEPEDEDDLNAFVAIEIQQLLHHSAETVLRLYVAHASGGASPWIELASLRSPGEFKDLVEREIVGQELPDDQVGGVCLGRRAPDADFPDGTWQATVEGLRAFLRRYGVAFLEDAPLYNAIKHGLGVAAGDGVLIINEHTMGHGASVDYPVASQWDNDERTWSLRTQWVDQDEAVALSFVAADMIDSIWAVGRRRFSPSGSPDVARLFVPTELRPTALRGRSRGAVHRATITVAVESRGGR